MNANGGRVRVGISGLGRSGYGIHAQALREMAERFVIHGVFDPWSERRREVGQEFGVREYSSFAEMLADAAIDLVVVAPPNRHHTAQSLQALEAGKHVLCEKPMALNAVDAQAMADAVPRITRITPDKAAVSTSIW